MQIIPVIDIKDGCAVLASLGNRKNYQPLSTPLCPSSRVVDVINAYLSVYEFPKIYIADLDALMGTGDNQRLIDSLFSRFPEIQFMIDSGCVEPGYTPLKKSQFTTIIGTESVDVQTLKNLKHQTNDFILSLDFSTHDTLMGESVVYESPCLWPKELIIMTLNLVGGNNGPGLSKLQHFCRSYPEHNFIAAGGIRDMHDLIQLQEIGIQQALIASSLHNGKFKNLDIQILIT